LWYFSFYKKPKFSVLLVVIQEGGQIISEKCRLSDNEVQKLPFWDVVFSVDLADDG